MGKLLQELGLFEPLHKQIVQGVACIGDLRWIDLVGGNTF